MKDEECFIDCKMQVSDVIEKYNPSLHFKWIEQASSKDRSFLNDPYSWELDLYLDFLQLASAYADSLMELQWLIRSNIRELETTSSQHHKLDNFCILVNSQVIEDPNQLF
jgi:hypothetical protein